MSSAHNEGPSPESPAFTAADVALLEEAYEHEKEWIAYKFKVDGIMTTGVHVRLHQLVARMRQYVRDHPSG